MATASTEYQLKGDDLRQKLAENRRQLEKLTEQKTELEKKASDKANKENKKKIKELLKFEFEERKKLQENYFKLRLAEIEEITDLEEKAAKARELELEARKEDFRGGFGLED